MQTNFNLEYYTNINKSMLAKIVSEFLVTHNNDNNITESTEMMVATKDSMEVFYKKIVGLIGDPHIKVCAYGSNDVVIYNDNVLIKLGNNDEYGDSDPSMNCFYVAPSLSRKILLVIYGTKNILTTLIPELKTTFNITHTTDPELTWYFTDKGQLEYRNVKLKQPKKIYDEFYPWIEGGIQKYIDRFMESESTILVLLGPPGTAKTTFINNLIWNKSLNSMFTYEDKILSSDRMFVDFIANPNKQLLITEDADLLLTSREADGNEVMSKFLNIGDGLMDITSKKMIFTANILVKSKIDSALIRSGRCFDCSMFRKLTYKEACKAAEVAKLDVILQNKEYSMAEIFALTQEYKPSNNIVKLGF